jgi:cytochrome c-type biogenesis protein CcmH
MRVLAASLCAAFLASAAAYAVEPNEMLKDRALEARAQAVSKTLRCVVCQNETIDDSDAPLAHDMRLLVRERLVAGDTDAQARAYLVARYGDFVLLKPPVQGDTIVLWTAPFALLAAGAALFVLRARTRRAPPTAPLTAEEERALAARLGAAPGAGAPEV